MGTLKGGDSDRSGLSGSVPNTSRALGHGSVVLADGARVNLPRPVAASLSFKRHGKFPKPSYVVNPRDLILLHASCCRAIPGKHQVE